MGRDIVFAMLVAVGTEDLVGLFTDNDGVGGRQCVRQQFVVTIEKHHVVALGLLHAIEPGTCHPSVRNMEDAQPRVFLCQPVTDGSRLVGALVVDSNDLEVVKRLV